MADAADSKSAVRKGVWVRVPPRARQVLAVRSSPALDRSGRGQHAGQGVGPLGAVSPRSATGRASSQLGCWSTVPGRLGRSSTPTASSRVATTRSLPAPASAPWAATGDRPSVRRRVRGGVAGQAGQPLAEQRSPSGSGADRHGACPGLGVVPLHSPATVGRSWVVSDARLSGRPVRRRVVLEPAHPVAVRRPARTMASRTSRLDGAQVLAHQHRPGPGRLHQRQVQQLGSRTGTRSLPPAGSAPGGIQNRRNSPMTWSMRSAAGVAQAPGAACPATARSPRPAAATARRAAGPSPGPCGLKSSGGAPDPAARGQQVLVGPGVGAVGVEADGQVGHAARRPADGGAGPVLVRRRRLHPAPEVDPVRVVAARSSATAGSVGVGARRPGTWIEPPPWCSASAQNRRGERGQSGSCPRCRRGQPPSHGPAAQMASSAARASAATPGPGRCVGSPSSARPAAAATGHGVLGQFGARRRPRPGR